MLSVAIEFSTVASYKNQHSVSFEGWTSGYLGALYNGDIHGSCGIGAWKVEGSWGHREFSRH